MASPATDLARTDVARIDAAYDVVRREEVLSFLEQHPFLVSILIEASQVIPSYFAPGFSLALELFTGPEDPEDRSLFVLIRTHLNSSEALALLDRFDEKWWLKRSYRTHGELTITVEH